MIRSRSAMSRRPSAFIGHGATPGAADAPGDVPDPFVALSPHPVTRGIMSNFNHMRDKAHRPPLYWINRCMFDHAFLGAPAVHRERAARLAGW